MTRASVPLIQELTALDAAVIAEVMRLESPYGPTWSQASVSEEIKSCQSLALRDAAGGLEAFILLRDVVDAFEIGYLATLARGRRRGLMRLLILRAQKMADAAGRPLWLEVHERNQGARALYEALGFYQTGRRPAYYVDGASAILYNYTKSLL